MNCKCLNKLEDDLKEKGYTDFSFDNKSFSIGKNTMMLVLMIPGNYQDFKKTGEPKKAKTKQNVVASYCPFCGKATEYGEPK